MHFLGNQTDELVLICIVWISKILVEIDRILSREIELLKC